MAQRGIRARREELSSLHEIEPGTDSACVRNVARIFCAHTLGGSALSNVREIQELVDDVRLVTDSEPLAAVGQLWNKEHGLAEPAGAATTAAVLQKPETGARYIVLIVSGSNISEDVMRKATQA